MEPALNPHIALLIVGLIDVIALVLAGTVAILRVRTQTGVEMAASMRLAEALVGDVANLTRHELPAEQFLSGLPAQLRSIRHVRITVKDARGAPVAVTPPLESAAGAGRASAPAAFAALVAPAIEFHELLVVADGDILVRSKSLGNQATRSLSFGKTRSQWEYSFLYEMWQ